MIKLHVFGILDGMTDIILVEVVGLEMNTKVPWTKYLLYTTHIVVQCCS